MPRCRARRSNCSNIAMLYSRFLRKTGALLLSQRWTICSFWATVWLPLRL